MTVPPSASRDARARLSEHARAIAEQADRHSVTLESLLTILRSPRLDDRASRQTALDLAAAALVALRTETDERGHGRLEPVRGAFARLKSELRPLVRFGELDVQFVEPPSHGRALPGEIAHSARAIVRNAVLALVDAADAQRVRIQWDCDGLNLLISIRDDGKGELLVHDDALRAIVEHVSALDGSIEVASTPGWGTDLTIDIPLDPIPIAAPFDQSVDLTDREREVLGHLGSGARNAEIAQKIGGSPHTVKFHVSKLLRKTGARNRAELVALVR